MARTYADISADMDRPIYAYAMLLLSVEHQDLIDVTTLKELGHTLEVYLDKRMIIESYFFGRGLKPSFLDDADVSGELCRLTLKLREAGWFGKRKEET